MNQNTSEENRNRAIGNRIRKARKDRGLTQKKLAESIGRTESSISEYEKGTVEAPRSILEGIAAILKIPTYELAGWKYVGDNTFIGDADAYDTNPFELMDAPTFGQRLREARKAAKMTQKELAEKTGIALSSIRLYESDKREPRKSGMEKIADILGVDANLLSYGDTLEKAITDKVFGDTPEKRKATRRNLLLRNYDVLADPDDQDEAIRCVGEIALRAIREGKATAEKDD